MEQAVDNSPGREEGLTPDLDSPRLSAPAQAVPRRGGKATVSLGDCVRVFARQPSPPYLLGAILLAVALRVPQGHWSWHDLAIAAGLVVVTPFVEWLIHVYLLHSPPFKLLGRRIEIVSAREHRALHEDPGVLGGDRLAGATSGLVVAYAILAGYEWTHFLIHTTYRPRRRFFKAIWRNHR